MKEMRKGNKVPYHGYLFNMGEYQKHKDHEELLEALLEYFEDHKPRGRTGIT